MPETLELGDVGPAVSTLQQMLIEQGYSVGHDGDSGIFSKATLSAVTLFQNGHVGPDGKPLKPDGVVGPVTWWALNNPEAPAEGGGIPPEAQTHPGNAIAAFALHAAVGELKRGVKEIPSGSNRGPRIDVYTGLVGKPSGIVGPPWCAYFVSWCFAQAAPGSPFGRISGAQALAFWGRKFGCTVMNPVSCSAGDIFVIARGEVHGHTGIVEAYHKGKIWTIEGNSGNAVRRLQRSLADCLAVVNFDRWSVGTRS